MCSVCEPGFYCASKTTSRNLMLNTMICPAGLHCPAGTNRTPDLVSHFCLEGHYCLRGDEVRDSGFRDSSVDQVGSAGCSPWLHILIGCCKCSLCTLNWSRFLPRTTVGVQSNCAQLEYLPRVFVLMWYSRSTLKANCWVIIEMYWPIYHFGDHAQLVWSRHGGEL